MRKFDASAHQRAHAVAAALPSQVEEQLKDCKGKKGVAAKVIRMTGRLGELFDVADALRVKMDLVIHLVRDPRAVLASRWSVGWLHPMTHSYEATLPWAKTMCDDMMIDASAGAGRSEYLLLRYEDLAGDAVERATMVYARIGAPVPDAVLREARVYDGCGSGSAQERAQCAADREAMNKNDDFQEGQYDTRPRDFAAQMNKWRKALTKQEVRAVEEGCADVFKFMYPHSKLDAAAEYFEA
eukprot:TRINITY_DN9211_c0_g1_i3.p1 TRINITY_DN9211_c0_g1~~TRINITY_DN9211_c0_g1_i3.p1  ORF type:complete len:241 (+),score=117.79 TRINITY_DN9211_c0_g1_i3:217-939(+)